MKNLSELKQHLYAVEQTKQITNAMYLLSTSRMKKSMQNIDFNLLYMKKLRGTMKDIISKTKRSSIDNKFIKVHKKGKAIFLILTSDKGLCGGFNSNVIELALKNIKEFESPLVSSLGIEGTQLLKAKGIVPDYEWFGASQHPTIYLARQIGEKIVELFEEKHVNEVYVVYTEYISSNVQQAVCKRILPLLRRDFADLDYEFQYTATPIYEPSVSKVFNEIVSQYIVGIMYDVFMQAATCENNARMTAMQNATKNADDMITNLSAQINAQRQLAITNEITEIAAASEMLGSV